MDGDLSFEKKNIDLSTPQNTDQISNEPQEIKEPSQKSSSVGGIFSHAKRENSLGDIEIQIDNKKVNQNVSISSQTELEKKKKKQKLCRERLQETCIKKIKIEKNIKVFFLLFVIGFVILFFSIFYIPLIFIAPSKFSMCISIGGILILFSFLFYYGTNQFFIKIFSGSRFWISIIYVFSIIIGTFVSYKKYYLFSLACCGMEVLTLLFFIGNFLLGCNCANKIIQKIFPFMKNEKNNENDTIQQ